MSIKDLIWVRVAQGLLFNRKLEFKKQELETQIDCCNNLYLIMADLRSIALDTNLFVRLNALKDTKSKKLKAFDTEKLPTISTEKEKKEKQLCAKMTPEELELYKFNKGEKVHF